MQQYQEYHKKTLGDLTEHFKTEVSAKDKQINELETLLKDSEHKITTLTRKV